MTSPRDTSALSLAHLLLRVIGGRSHIDLWGQSDRARLKAAADMVQESGGCAFLFTLQRDRSSFRAAVRPSFPHLSFGWELPLTLTRQSVLDIFRDELNEEAVRGVVES